MGEASKEGTIIEQILNEVAEYTGNFRGLRKLVSYPGGDYFIFDQLNRFFNLAKASVFVEVFGGSCWCSLNVSRSKFKVIVCNDIDQDLITLYRLIKENPGELAKRLAILPFSREVRSIALEVLNDKTADPLTRAVVMFYAIRSSFFGVPGKRGSFRVSRTTNEARQYSEAVTSIVEYARRFKDVVLECEDFRKVIELYDSSDTLFYLDPPYVGRDYYYRYEFSVADLKAMAVLLRNVKGLWVLKIAEDNYKLVKDLLPNHEVERIEGRLRMAIPEERVKKPELNLLIAHNIKTPKLG